MGPDEAVDRARQLFLDDRHVFGCAETTFVVLKEAFGLPDPADSSAAMALNGGVAYSGDVCGAISGATLAVGLLAGACVRDHLIAKRVARTTMAATVDAFRARFGAVDCRELIGLDIRTEQGHRAFIESGVWREQCMAQIEFAVRRLATLSDETNLEAWPGPDPRPETAED